MSANFLKGSLLLAMFLLVFTACEQNAVEPNNNKSEEVPDAARIIKIQTEINQVTGLGNAFGAFSEAGFSKISQTGRQKFGSKLKSDQARVACDSTDNDHDSCALVSVSEKADGSVTVELDYGDGCEEYGMFISGIVRFTGYEEENGGIFTVEFEDYSETPIDWEEDEIDSTESEGDHWGDLDFEPHTLNGFYTASYSWEENEVDSAFSYDESYETDLRIDYEDDYSEEFEATGNTRGDEEGHTVLENDFSGSNSDGDSFSGSVLAPLYFDYSCTESFIWVSGVEEFHYNDESATINYGDGDCDNILEITEEGIIIIIDLDKVDWWGDEHDDDLNG